MKELGWPWNKQMCRGKWARWQTAHCRQTLHIYHPLEQVQSWNHCKGLWAVCDLHNEAQDNFNIPKVFSAWPGHRKVESAAVTLQPGAWNLPCATSGDIPACHVKTQEGVPTVHSHYVVNELLSVCGRGLQLCVGGRFSRKIFHYAEETLWWAAAAIPLALVKQLHSSYLAHHIKDDLCTYDTRVCVACCHLAFRAEVNLTWCVLISSLFLSLM